jgi:hypothetical protein
MAATSRNTVPAITSPRVNARRRTKRIALTVPVEVSGKDIEKTSFSIRSTATNLNRNGAMLHLNRDLPVDSVIVIQNNRGIRTSARVVSQTTTAANCYAYGVEFLEDNNVQSFWGIHFPGSQVRR